MYVLTLQIGGHAIRITSLCALLNGWWLFVIIVVRIAGIVGPIVDESFRHFWVINDFKSWWL
jgi:hypothetical protein